MEKIRVYLEAGFASSRAQLSKALREHGYEPEVLTLEHGFKAEHEGAAPDANPMPGLPQGPLPDGAVALIHDVNNALSAVASFSAFVVEGLDEHPCLKDAEIVVASCRRAIEGVAKLRALVRESASHRGEGAEVATSAVWPRAKRLDPAGHK